MEIDEWKAQIERERREKDGFFAGHRQSPIPPEDRAKFRGLDYYPPDPDCRFEIELHEHKDKSDSEEERLFIPFRDATSGQETYGAGRYLDLDSARNRTADGKWILDLNRAYNPWCVYSENYTCPFVPQENWLAVPVRAGEKNYSNK